MTMNDDEQERWAPQQRLFIFVVLMIGFMTVVVALAS
jgi:hypothetical protein